TAGVLTGVMPGGTGSGPRISLTDDATTSVVSGLTYITYTLTYQNLGDAPSVNVILENVLPEGTTYVSSGTLNGNRVQWNVGTVSPSDPAKTVSFVVHL